MFNLEYGICVYTYRYVSSGSLAEVPLFFFFFQIYLYKVKHSAIKLFYHAAL